MTNRPSRAAIYLNKIILPAHSYESIAMEISDMIAIVLWLNQKQHPILIINIYNIKRTSLLMNLWTHLWKHLRDNTYNGIIIAGDFNLHHPLWNSSNYHEQDSEADVLIDIMSQLRLKSMLPADTIIFSEAKTAIDLVWGNEFIEWRIIKCRIAKVCDHGSDHHPIETILNLQSCSYGSESQQRYNYKKMDWKIFE